ncbi:ParB/RepB/Spo0J family partition protein [Planosporangium sp. 12N6]|uniref:ParB/RepB/Spo0J family partition protein n=1 Tax=Planosporangium spinosum TaxID=3402278 RepID=UPI003CEAD334
MRDMGRRVNLSSLADDPVLPEARVPSFADTTPRSIRVDQVAPNPLNTRDVKTDPTKITKIAESLRVHGQLQPCAVVSRGAFLTAFPEFSTTIGTATYVQVTGARRRAAAIEAGLTTLDIAVKDHLAASRSSFVAATAAENIDREDYDPIEEAQAVQLLVQECGSGKDAAAQLAKTPAWVSQRLNLLKLTPEMQALVRTGELPIRVARDIGAKFAPEEQLGEWKRQQEQAQLTAVNRSGRGDAPTEEPPSPSPDGATGTRRSPAAVAIRRLGGTPEKIAVALRAELHPDDLKALIDLLQQEHL